MTGEELQQLQHLISENTSLGIYINLTEEAEAKRRVGLSQKYIIGRLMRNDGRVERSRLVQESEFTDDEIAQSINFLSQRNWINVEGDEVTFASINSDGQFEHIIDLFRYWFSGEMLFPALYEGITSSFYKRHINDQLLDHVTSIQGQLKLSRQHKEDILNILKVSPRALYRAIHAYELITNHRVGQSLIDNEEVNETDANLFLEYILNGLLADFNDQNMAHFYSVSNGIVELEHRREVSIKTSKALHTTTSTRVRHRIHPSNVQGGFVHLLVFNSHPEPWEEQDINSNKDFDFEQF
jgi:hypothetical protein